MKNLTTQLRSASLLSLDFVGVVPKKKSPMELRIGWGVVGLLSLVLFLAPLTVGQTPAQTASALPHLVRFAGTVKDLGGSPLTGMVGITFALYAEQAGSTPLWLETQNVTADNTGRYTVLLGSTKSEGLPEQLFTSEQAHWVGVQISGQPEQPRVLLVSAPYALKAGDAETIGGLPPSAFMLAAPGGERGAGVGSSSSSSPNPGANIGGSGTLNFIPIWTDSSGDLGNSILFQSGGTEVGIGTTTPAATLDVNGGVISRGSLQLPSTGTATSGSGFNSQPFLLQGSSFNSGTQKAIGPVFQWQTEPSGNNTSSPAGTLNLLYGSGSGSPTETGLNIASSGKITFASGQTFPGTGTITGITAGSGLTGGGTSGNVTLSINVANANKTYAQLAAANIFTKNQTVNGTVTATSFSGNGSGLTNVTAANALNLGGLPPSAYQPAGSYATTGSNTFTGNQNITGNVAATGSVSGAAATFTGLVTEAGALLPATGTATATQGFNSEPLDSVTSAFNSTGGTAQNQDFRWLAEPVGNDTSSPSGKLDLLFGANGATPAETGLSVASNGQITFATGQTFPGGSGTVTSVGSGLGLKGGPITTSGTLTIDTTVIPQLNAANTFAANQTVNGTLLATSSSLAVQAGATSVNGVGINALSSATTGTGVGVIGATNSPAGNGVIGTNNAAAGTTAGVLGQASSPAGYGVEGSNVATTGSATGVYGTTSSTGGYGVEGQSPYVGVVGQSSATSAGAGVLAITGSLTGFGVYGENIATSGDGAGVSGTSSSPIGFGVEGTSPNIGVFGNSTAAGGFGVAGNAFGPNSSGVTGQTISPSSEGVYGFVNATSGNTAGVYGETMSLNGYGVEGQGPEVGVYGQSTSESALGHEFLVETGLWGDGGTYGYGVLATTDSGTAGIFANNSSQYAALVAQNNTESSGTEVFLGQMPDLLGIATNAIIGDAVCGEGFMALQLGQQSMSGCNNYTLMGDDHGNTYLNALTGETIHLRINNQDALTAVNGSVSVRGNFSVSGNKNFRIDHPLDPANKYLFHASIESSEVLNLYSGNVVLDGSGEAVVQLPDWFEVINKDFRYQLTPIGAPGRDLYIAEEVSGGHFTIAGGKPGGKVSWQVSGVRNDAWEKAHPMEVEADKGADRGHYLTPELYGAPETAAIGYMAPAPGTEHVVHQRPAFPQRRNAAQSQERAPLRLPMPQMPAPRMPVPPKAPVLPHAAMQTGGQLKVAAASTDADAKR